jgi:hypothetical protein
MLDWIAEALFLTGPRQAQTGPEANQTSMQYVPRAFSVRAKWQERETGC